MQRERGRRKPISLRRPLTKSVRLRPTTSARPAGVVKRTVRTIHRQITTVNRVNRVNTVNRANVATNRVSMVQRRLGQGRLKRAMTDRASHENFINQKNRLAGPEGVSQTGAPIESQDLYWPVEIPVAFSISMRPLRWQGMQARLGDWKSKVQLFPATNGQLLNPKKWQAERKLAVGSQMRRGEIGCYDSHVRVWQKIVDSNLPAALILEDDANLRHTAEHANRIKQAFEELKAKNIPWDLLYYGRGRQDIHASLGGSLAKPKGCSGLFAYAVTQAGAQKLLSRAKPYRDPVDVFVARLHDTNVIQAVTIHPSLFYVVPVRSDTAHIY